MIPLPVSRSALCPHCGKDVRSCRNCRFFDSPDISGCRESRADPVPDREKANFCDWFSLDLDRVQSSDAHLGRSKTARDAFSSLFSQGTEKDKTLQNIAFGVGSRIAHGKHGSRNDNRS